MEKATFFLFLIAHILSSFSQAQTQNVGSSSLEAPPVPPAPEFVVYDREGMPCILVKMMLNLVIEPKRTANKKINISAPKSATITGNCGDGEESKMIVAWGSFKFLWHFQKSRVSDAWYVDRIELSYNTSDKAFGNTTQDFQGVFQQLHSQSTLTLFMTKDIKIYDDAKSARVTVQLSRFQIQPFALTTHRQYGDEYKCIEEAGRRNDTMPFIVAGILAMAVLGTIGGYGGYRYMKVKKIDYDTME